MFWPSIDTGQSYLINVGVPHFGEEAESRWRVRVVDGELDPSLRAREDVYYQRERQAVYLHFSLANRQVMTTSAPNYDCLGEPFPQIRSEEPHCLKCTREVGPLHILSAHKWCHLPKENLPTYTFAKNYSAGGHSRPGVTESRMQVCTMPQKQHTQTHTERHTYTQRHTHTFILNVFLHRDPCLQYWCQQAAAE